jgi:hypothetical protein
VYSLSVRLRRLNEYLNAPFCVLLRYATSRSLKARLPPSGRLRSCRCAPRPAAPFWRTSSAARVPNDNEPPPNTMSHEGGRLGGFNVGLCPPPHINYATAPNDHPDRRKRIGRTHKKCLNLWFRHGIANAILFWSSGEVNFVTT